MSVVVSAVSPGLNAEMYEAVSGRVMPGDQLPDGCELHIAGPVEQGWRVITECGGRLKRFIGFARRSYFQQFGSSPVTSLHRQPNRSTARLPRLYRAQRPDRSTHILGRRSPGDATGCRDRISLNRKGNA
jgi:hypothetical protein